MRQSFRGLFVIVLWSSGCVCAGCDAPSPAATEPSWLNAETVVASGKQLAVGKAHGCSLDAAISGISCWGDDRFGQASPPSFLSPTSVAAGGDSSCAIASGFVACWGDLSAGQSSVPLLIGPKQLAVGDAHVCALTEAGEVRCWGDDTSGQLRVPVLSDVQAIAAGARHTCALSTAGVTCWGDAARGQLTVPQLAAPQQLTAAGDTSCVLDAGAVRCWGGVGALLDQVPQVEEPVALGIGSSQGCVLDRAGVRCWGEATTGDLKPPELTRVTQLVVGGGAGHSHACARHLQGVRCWGDDNVGQSSYDGGELHTLHHSESRVAAPADRVWAVIVDLDRYPEWNPYTIAMKSTLQVGEAMQMTVKMNELVTLEQTEYIRVIERDHKICWGIDTDTPEFNSGERCQWLEALPEGGTRYVTEDLIEGTANPLVTALFGSDVQRGFDAVASALKARVEGLR